MRIKQSISGHYKNAFGIIGVVVLVMFYGALSYRQHNINPNDTTIPTFKQLYDGVIIVCTPQKNRFDQSKEVKSVKDQIVSTMFFKDFCATYMRLFEGMAWGCFASIIIGVLMGCYECISSLLFPTLSFLSKVPGTSMLAVFFAVVGIGEPMFAAMIGFGILPTLTQSIYFSVRDDLHMEEIDKAYTLGASHTEVIWEVVFQQILPKIVDNIRLQLGPSMVYLIAAEMLVGQVGIGFQIRQQQRLTHMNIVYDYIVFLGMTGLAFDKLFVVLRNWICPWFEKAK